MRLLVTGGAGFIGSNFVRRILDGSLSGISSLVVLDKLTYSGKAKTLDSMDKRNFEFHKGDIADPSIVEKITRKIDAVVNFAAESHVDRSIKSAKEFVHTNILGAHNLMEISLKNEVKTFVQISTDEVYGSIQFGSWTEDFPLKPNSPYSATKASADLLARSYFQTYGFDIRITRSSNNYGPFQFPEKLIPYFITNLLKNKKVPLYGDGKNVRDWLHVDDHCNGIHKVLCKGRPGETYNIGGGEELTNLELTKTILSKMNKDENQIMYVEDRLGHDARYSLDISKIKDELGYEPKIKFDEGITKTIDWYLENTEWLDRVTSGAYADYYQSMYAAR